MRIKDVEAYWLRCPIPPERQHVSDFGRLTTFDMTLVVVTTEDGRDLASLLIDAGLARAYDGGKRESWCR